MQTVRFTVAYNGTALCRQGIDDCPARNKEQRCKQPKFERQTLLAQNHMLYASLFV